MEAFTHNLYKDPDTMVVEVRDRAALDSSEDLVKFYREQIAKGILNWDVDLRPIEMIHSAGLGMLVAFNLSVTSRGGHFRLILSKDSKLTNLIKLSKLDRIMNLVIA